MVESETIDFIQVGFVFTVPFLIWLVNQLGIIEIPFIRGVMLLGFLIAIAIIFIVDKIFKR